MTSDDRREIAARLREAAIDDGHVGRPYGEKGFQVTLRRIIGTSNPKRPTLYTRLADLIDPTCHAVHSDTAADNELVCSECGALVGVEMTDGKRLFSRYCECCGARVTNGGEG